MNNDTPSARLLGMALNGALALMAICLRPFRSKDRKLVVLYGPKLNGNNKAFADYLDRSGVNVCHYAIAYATSDSSYYQELCDAHVAIQVLSTSKIRDMVKICQASAIITTHDAGPLAILSKLTDIKFVNVWHGIGWKGHAPEDFLFLKDYADTWVTSPAFMDIYKNAFQIGSPIHVTGYARTDDAVRGNFSALVIKKKYDVTDFKKIILIAPTWEQNHGNHSIYPFNLDAGHFFKPLNDMARRGDALIIFRTHMNSGSISLPRELKNVVFMPSDVYPVTEEFLCIADILVTDWSSIVFDYLPLKRPVLFLDVPVPYELLCFEIGYRFGEVIETLDKLVAAIERYSKQPNLYTKRYAKSIKKAVQLGYGTTLDGKSAERYHQRLLALIKATDRC
jgi:CDP-ribitol ribitolphosphotransferase